MAFKEENTQLSNDEVTDLNDLLSKLLNDKTANSNKRYFSSFYIMKEIGLELNESVTKLIQNNELSNPHNRDEVMSHNVGDSDYAKNSIQPWDVWEEYVLNPWDADIIKRTLREKESQSRRGDYEKIIHICQKRISQIDNGVKMYGED